MTETFTAVAGDRVQFELGGYFEIPAHTATGVVCGACSKVDREITGDRRAQARHASAAHVRHCFAVRAEMDAEAEAEQAAERAARNYDECGQLLWDDEGLEDLYRHPYDPQAH